MSKFSNRGAATMVAYGALAIVGLGGASGCATTEGSSGSTFGGIASNFRGSAAAFQGTFYDTLDMSTVAAGHYEASSQDVVKLALTGDPRTARGFLGTVHSSIFFEHGSTANLVTDPAITKPLTNIKTRLLEAWDGPAPEIAVIVSADQGYHGYAYKDNFIVLPVGALLDLTSEAKVVEGQQSTPGTEDELASFMAHEISHILLGHYKRAEGASMRDKLNRTAAKISTVGIAASGMQFRTVGGQMSVTVKNPQETQELAQKAALYSSILSEANLLMNASASREQEDHCDMLAADLLARAGYQSMKVSDFLQRSATGEEAAANRARALNDQQKVIAGNLAQSLGAGQGSVFGDVLGTVAVQFYADWMGKLTSTHRTTKARQGNVNKYLERFVAVAFEDNAEGVEDKLKTPTAEKQKAVARGEVEAPASALDALKKGRARQLLEAYRKAFEAKNVLASGNVDAVKQAGALIDEAMKAAPNEPEILEIASTYYVRAGDPRKALQLIQKAVALEGASHMIYASLADRYFLTGQPEQALVAIQTGEERLGTKAPFFPYRINYLAQKGSWAEATEVNKECKATKSEALAAKCEENYRPVAAALEAQRQKELEQSPLLNLPSLFGKKD